MITLCLEDFLHKTGYTSQEAPDAVFMLMQFHVLFTLFTLFTHNSLLDQIKRFAIVRHKSSYSKESKYTGIRNVT